MTPTPSPAIGQEQTEREAFEAWAEPTGVHIYRGRDGEYITSRAQESWKAWQARAAITQAAPAHSAQDDYEHFLSYSGLADDAMLRYAYFHGANNGIDKPQAAPAETWQPIETAPKDGRTILLGHLNRAGKWRTARGQWMSEDYIAEYWEDQDTEAGWFETVVSDIDTPNCWGIEPTHWMPLPAAPLASKEST